MLLRRNPAHSPISPNALSLNLMSNVGQIAPTLEKALSAGRAAVVDCVLEEPANVYPMVTGLSLMEYVE